jgi:thioredoxin-dependent peroxiredoxin
MARRAKVKPTGKKPKTAKKAVNKPKKPLKKLVKLVVKKQKPIKRAKLSTVKKRTRAVSRGLTIGSQVPEFSMPATFVGTVSHTSLKGKPFVLYFYPKDDTSGCTAEACEFRNELSGFKQCGAMVIGVSKDNLDSHEKFSRKYHLSFPLASDETSDVCERFGVWVQKSMYGRTYMGIERSTFLVDAKGCIRAHWRKVSVSGHVAEVKKALEDL